jgi:hypothetical protein
MNKCFAVSLQHESFSFVPENISLVQISSICFYHLHQVAVWIQIYCASGSENDPVMSALPSSTRKQVHVWIFWYGLKQSLHGLCRKKNQRSDMRPMSSGLCDDYFHFPKSSLSSFFLSTYYPESGFHKIILSGISFFVNRIFAWLLLLTCFRSTYWLTTRKLFIMLFFSE